MIAKKSKYLTITERMAILNNEDPCIMFNDRIMLKIYYLQFHGISTFLEIVRDSRCPTFATVLRVRRLYHVKEHAGYGCPRLEDETVEGRIIYLLRDYPATRSSDKLLIAMYLHNYHNITTLSEYILDDDAPEVATIANRRRAIQKRGEYPSNKVVKVGRLTEEFNHHHHFKRKNIHEQSKISIT